MFIRPVVTNGAETMCMASEENVELTTFEREDYEMYSMVLEECGESIEIYKMQI